jgi:hypothetical protein
VGVAIPISRGFDRTATSIPLVSTNRAPRQTLGASVRIREIADDDAAVILTRGRKRVSDKSTLAAEDLPGPIPDALASIAKISQQIRGLRSELTKVDPASEKGMKAQSEIAQLVAEYSRVVSSDGFKKVLDFLNAANSSLASGTSPDAIYRGARGSVGEVGSAILGLIQRGETATLGALTKNLDDLTKLDLSSVLQNPGVLDTLDSLVKGVSTALSGAGPTTETPITKSEPGLKSVIEAPKLQELTFEGADQLALSLRSYSSKDLIKAAAAGVSLDPANVLVLTAADPRDRDRTEDEEDPETIDTVYRGESV